MRDCTSYIPPQKIWSTSSIPSQYRVPPQIIEGIFGYWHTSWYLRGNQHSMTKGIRKKSPQFTDFQIHGGTFDYSVNIILSKDLERCASYVNLKHETTRYSSSDFDCQGKVFFSQGLCPVLWLPSAPTTSSEQGTAIHELLHIVFEITNWAGVRYSPESEEIYTHLLKHLYRQFCDKTNI